MGLTDIEKLELLCQTRICFIELRDHMTNNRVIPGTDTLIKLIIDGLDHVTALVIDQRRGMPTYPSPRHQQEDRNA